MPLIASGVEGGLRVPHPGGSPRPRGTDSRRSCSGTRHRLLGAAAARPQTTVFGEDAYPDVWTKAAALLQSIVQNHPLVDGNKRLGWLATAVFLELNGVKAVGASNDDVYDLVMNVATGHDPVEEIAAGLRAIVRGGPAV